MSRSAIHPDFRLNGVSFTEKSLKDAAYGFVKDGKSHEKAIGEFLREWLDGAPTIGVHTSGSTGVPKRITLRKQQMIHSALATGAYFGLHPKNSAFLCLSAAYIAGKMMLVRAMVLGLHLDSLAPDANPLNEIEKEYDFGAMVPLQLQNSIPQIGQVKTLLVGGAPLSFALKQKLKNVTARIFETYGMTETITHIAVKEIATESNSVHHPETFKALPGVMFGTDKRNCLVVDAPRVTEGAITTNDVVELQSKTEFAWLGRYDNVINSGGVKLHPEIIEEKLAPLIASRFFVAGLPDEVLGQQLILLVEGNIDSEKLLEATKGLQSLSKYEVPKKIYSQVEFMETGSGKINRNRTVEKCIGVD